METERERPEKGALPEGSDRGRGGRHRNRLDRHGGGLGEAKREVVATYPKVHRIAERRQTHDFDARARQHAHFKHPWRSIVGHGDNDGGGARRHVGEGHAAFPVVDRPAVAGPVGASPAASVA